MLATCAANHLCGLHLYQALTWALLDFFIHELRRDVHLCCRYLVVVRCDPVLLMLVVGVLILFWGASHISALLVARAHLLVMRQLAYHCSALGCAHSARIWGRLHRGYGALMRMMSSTHRIRVLWCLDFKLIAALHHQLLARMELFKSCLVL